MNVTAVSAMAERGQDFSTLQNTLQAGNLAGAQRAFAAFLQDVQRTAQRAGPAGLFAPGTQASRDLEALGGALKSANLPGAQRALASLEQDIQIVGQSGHSLSLPHVHHPLTHSEIANNGVAALESVAPGGAAAQSIGSILNLHA